MTNNKPQDSIGVHYKEAVQWRRTLHRCPQPSWLEFFATAFVAEKMSGWGYDVKLGRDVVAENKLLLLPDPATLQAEYDRAIKAGANEKFLAPARGGFTGVVATLKGELPGPTVGFRFDIDSNEVAEARDPNHLPAREGFVSENPGFAHMCGHDIHTATGLLLAKYFADNRKTLKGTVKFLFQPNEENLSGAAAMIEKGHLDDLDYLVGGHIGLATKETGHVCFNIHSFMALSRFEVTFTGRPTHAAASPEQGKNAMLGACNAVTNLYAIARNSKGATRINVGILQAGSTWNVIAEKAYFRMETRGVSNELNDYMVEKAREVIEGAAKMYGLSVEMKPAAEAVVADSSPELIAIAERVAKTLPSVKQVVPSAPFNASEDVTLMIERVRQKGGKALFAMFGTPTHGGHHNSTFDADEIVMRNAAEFYAALQKELAG
ncbi:MAG TPA: amidohydrolase [Syntrophales bacterium]|nr:amidohydrolase [Syntrophales bacterium]